MFDFLRNLTKSDEEKQQEAFSAYLDDALSPSQRQAFEQRLAEDADLRTEIELAQMIRQQMQEMPRRSLPRSFTLDPGVYGAPQKEPLVQAYPLLRAATVLTAFFFVLALSLSVFTSQGGGDTASVAQTALEPAPALEAPLAEAEVSGAEVTEEKISEGVFEEEVVIEEEPAAEEAAEAAPAPEMTLAATAEAEIPLEEEAAMDMTESGANEAGLALATPTALPTATTSSLPRLAATETAVPRAAQATLAADEVANAIETETAVSEAPPLAAPPRTGFSLSLSQWVLIGLGLLLLVLVGLTLLAWRRL